VPEPVQGAEVLDQTLPKFYKVCGLAGWSGDALALWCAHTHRIEAFAARNGHVTPPEKGCGKTNLLRKFSFSATSSTRRKISLKLWVVRVIEKISRLSCREVGNWLRDKPDLIRC